MTENRFQTFLGTQDESESEFETFGMIAGIVDFYVKDEVYSAKSQTWISSWPDAQAKTMVRRLNMAHPLSWQMIVTSQFATVIHARLNRRS